MTDTPDYDVIKRFNIRAEYIDNEAEEEINDTFTVECAEESIERAIHERISNLYDDYELISYEVL